MHHLVLGIRDHFGLAKEQEDDRLLHAADREWLVVTVKDKDFTRKGWAGGVEIVVVEVGMSEMAIIGALQMLESGRARSGLPSMIMLVLVALSGFMRFSRVECYCPPF